MSHKLQRTLHKICMTPMTSILSPKPKIRKKHPLKSSRSKFYSSANLKTGRKLPSSRRRRGTTRLVLSPISTRSTRALLTRMPRSGITRNRRTSSGQFHPTIWIKWSTTRRQTKIQEWHSSPSTSSSSSPKSEKQCRRKRRKNDV